MFDDFTTIKSNFIFIVDNQMQEIKGLTLSIPSVVSAYHLVIWIFAVKKELAPAQRLRIQKMYGMQKQIINPIVSTVEDFKRLLVQIKDSNKNCIIKVVSDKKMLKQINEISLNDRDILQIFLYDQSRLLESSTEDYQERYFSGIVNKNSDMAQSLNKSSYSQIVPKKSKIYKVIQDMEECIELAEKQVQKCKKTFRTFHNSHLLIGDFEKINRYRFRLLSFMNLKVSDFEDSYKMFKEFAKSELPCLNKHLQGINKNQITRSQLIIKLENYYQIANQFIWNENKKSHKDYILNREKQLLKEHSNSGQDKNEDKALNKESNKSQSQLPKKLSQDDIKSQIYKEQFYHSILSIYQEEGLFYHFLNSNLKLVGEKNANWKQFSLPFNHVFHSIKYLYRKEVSEKNEFYLRPFIVYRGGRARKSELKTYDKYKGRIFIEFYGFLSTSQSAKIIADKFVSYSSSMDWNNDSDQTTEDYTDEQVIFRIEVNPNEKILHEKYDFLVNGFFKMGQFQKYGDREKQVLFNALSVFKLKDIRKIIISDLFSQQQKIAVQQNQEIVKSLRQTKYKIQKVKLESYNRQITVIDLQFGSFYDVILQPNKYNLTPQQRQGKQNYVYCMNKIRQCQQFDFGDAEQFTNQLQKCYSYLKSKVAAENDNEEQQLMISLIDKKNYFQKLSTVCNKLGKVKQALNYNKIAIKCHTQLYNISLKNAFNQYYEKLLDMKSKSIQIYQQSADYSNQAIELKEQLEMIRSKDNSEKPMAQVKESQIYISQAINCYSRGKLEESKNRFKKCQYKLAKILSKYSFEIQQQCCYCWSFLKNVFSCKGCSYKKFVQGLIKEKKDRRILELTEKYGSQQMLQEISRLSNELLKMVHHATNKRNELFKSRKKYEQFISKFSHQFTIFQKCQQNESQKANIINSIRQNIIEMSGLQLDNERYKQLNQSLQRNIQKLDYLSLNSLELTEDQTFIKDFIKKFKQKEMQKRLKSIKERVSIENRSLLVQQYIKCAKEIEESIQELKKQGYVEKTFNILKKRNQMANIYYQAQSRDLAFAQINRIIQNGTVENQDRHLQLATAYLTKGKIQFENKNIIEAIQSFDRSIQFLKQSVTKIANNQQDQLQVSQIFTNKYSQNIEQLDENKQPENHQQNQLNNNDKYLQARLYKLKALLIWVQKLKIQQNGCSQNLFDDHNQNWQSKHSQFHMRNIESQILALNNIIDDKQLKCILLQIMFYKNLNLPPNKMKITDIFKPFRECLVGREHNQDKNNSSNYLMCSDFILRHHKKSEALQYFIKNQYDNYLVKAEVQMANSSSFWKIKKAKYFILKQRQQNNNNKLLQNCLFQAIQILKHQVYKNKRPYLAEELEQLQLIMNEKDDYFVEFVDFQQSLQMQKNENELQIQLQHEQSRQTFTTLIAIRPQDESATLSSGTRRLLSEKKSSLGSLRQQKRYSRPKFY